MNNIVGLESIKTEKGQIDTKNAKLPQVESYAEFWNILTNQKREAIYTKVDTIDEITIIPDVSNNPSTPEQNKYAIQKEQKTNNGTIQVQLCYVVGKTKIENFLSQYIRHDIKQYKELVQIQINETTEKTEIILSSQQELSTLVDEITEYDYTPEGVKDYFKNATALHKDIQKDYDASYKLIKDRQKNGQKPTLLEKNMLKLLEHKYMKDTKNIEQLERTIKSLGKEYKKETNVDMWKQNSKETYLQLLYYRSQGQKLSGLLHNESAQKNFVDNPDIYMDIPVESTQDAALLKTVYDNMSKERFRINELLTDANFKNIKDKNGQTMQDYLNSTLEEGSTAKEPFVPSSEYQSEYNEVLKNYPQLQEWIQMYPSETTNTSTTNTGNTNPNEKEIYNNPQYMTKPGKGGFLDKITLGFISQGIDNSSMSPSEKEGAKKVAGIVSLIGLGALAIRGWKKAFSKDSKFEGKDRFIGGLAATLFAGSMITSKTHNPLDFKSLGDKIASRFSASPDNIPGNEENADPEKTTLGGIVTMNTLFQGMNGAQIKSILKDDNGKMSINYDAAKIIIEANKGNISNANERLQIIDSLKNSPNQGLVPVALEALGITSEKLAANTGKKYEEFAEKGIDRFMDIYTYMEANGYKKWNKEMTNYIYKYMRGEQGYSLDKLGKMGAFEKDENLPTSPDALKNNIQSLTILKTNQEKEQLYLQAYKVFNELKNNSQYKGELKFTEANGILYLETYTAKTAIDITNKKLGNIPLYTTYQTLKAANLTNRLQDIFKGKADIEKPFNISALGDIEFQKKSLTSTEGWKDLRQFAKDKFDTEAVAAGRGGTLKNIAPSLEDNKQAYIDYLNALPGRKK